MIHRLVALGGLALVCQLDALAQEKPSFVFNTEVQASCLTLPPQAAPRFPEAPANAAGGVVRIRMRFADADSPPQVEVFTNTAGAEYAVAVQAHVEAYRFRCLRSVRPTTTLNQEFQFVVRNVRSVLASRVRYFRRDVPCEVKMPDPPEYPRGWNGSAALDRVPDAGTALVGLYFTAADAAPAVRVLYDGGSRHYARTAEPHASGIRVQCEGGDPFPVIGVVPYRFRMAGDPEPRTATVSLADFLGVLEGLDSAKVYFDFNTMNCPFEFSFYPLRPHYSNVTLTNRAAGEDRAEFLSWLNTVTLKLPDKVLNDLRGNALKVQVPCVVMNFL